MSTEDDPGTAAPWIGHGSCGATADGCVCVNNTHADTIAHHCWQRHIVGQWCGARWFGTWGTDSFEPVTYSGGEPA